MARLLFLLLAAGAIAFAVSRFLARRRRERLALIRSTFLVGTSGMDETKGALKDIRLRDGTVSFRVPEHWSEEYPDPGHAVLRDAGPPLRVLRVASEVGGGGDLRASLEARSGPEATTLEDLPDGRVLLKCLDASREEGQDRTVFRWLTVASLSSARSRLATFALSVPAETALDPLTRSIVRLLDREIRRPRSNAE